MTCTASGTTSSAFPVAVDQCNGSENGGGSFVTCTTSITTNVVDTSLGGGTPTGVPPAGTPTGGPPGGTPTGPATPTPPVVVPPGFLTG